MRKNKLRAALMLSFLFALYPFWSNAQSGEDPITDAASVLPTVTANTNWTQEKIYHNPSRTYFQTGITYYDGLGRPVQRIAARAAGNYTKDIVRPIQYDAMGRSDAKTYLPFVSAANNNGRQIANAPTVQSTYYLQNFPASDPDREYPYAVANYSTAGIVTSASGTGKSSHEKPVYYEHRLNTAADGIKRFRMSTANSSSLNYMGVYPAGSLMVQTTEQSDLPAEQRVKSYVFIDQQGRTVAVRDHNTDQITYYVYDELGRERYIITPMQNQLLSTTGDKALSTLVDYCYYKEYDRYGRVIKSYSPDCEPIYYVYDFRDRLVLTQDGNLRAEDQWFFTKYDNQNRPVMTGIHTRGTHESHISEIVRNGQFAETIGGAFHGYTNMTYPILTDVNQVHVVHYYDDYNWLSGSTHAYSSADGLGAQPNYDLIGLQTGSKSKVLGIDTQQWLTTVNYYDDHYQTIQSIADLYPSGKEVVSNKLNFSGQVTQTYVKQTVGSITYAYNKWFNYDAYGRLKNIRQQIAEDALVTLASYEYDDMGNISRKHIHNNSETSEYTYTISGQNTGVHSPSFSYDLWFDKSPTGLTPRQDGKLAHVTWGNNDAGNQKGYTMTYESNGHQMTSARYLEGTGTAWSATDKYAERNITYDLNGNIREMIRTDGSQSEIHNMEYVYDYTSGSQRRTGHALRSIRNFNAAHTFDYDPNGNMTRDGMTGVQVQYNILNLPQRIFAGNNQIKYIYSGTGEKLASETTVGGTRSLTYYRSVMVYGQSGSNAEQLQYILHPEGMAAKTTGAFEYRYFKADHLGSTRVMLTANGTTLRADQTTDYYPFGLSHGFSNTTLNKYLYGGKELQDAALTGSALQLYDFHARFYNPVYGRWFNPDPALQTSNPYLYCANSPMMYVDPDGQWVVPLLVGAIYGMINGAMMATVNQSSVSQGVLWGGLTGIATAGLGAFAPTSLLGSITYNSALHGLSSGALWQATGGNFKEGFQAGSIHGTLYGLATSEQFSNLVRGQGFRNNDVVLDRFVTQGEFQQAMEYFGIEGKFDPYYEGFTSQEGSGASAVTNP